MAKTHSFHLHDSAEPGINSDCVSVAWHDNWPAVADVHTDSIDRRPPGEDVWEHLANSWEPPLDDIVWRPQARVVIIALGERDTAEGR